MIDIIIIMRRSTENATGIHKKTKHFFKFKTCLNFRLKKVLFRESRLFIEKKILLKKLTIFLIIL
jgi:hypothetical protein